jgi:branched-chain amino acid aminotransferase
MMMIYLNGKFVSKMNARVSVFDHGFLYGDGIFESLRTYNGELLLFPEHYQRLLASAKTIALRVPLNETQLRRAVETTIRKNKLREARVRICLSRGEGPLGFSPLLCKKPTLAIMALPFKPLPKRLYRDGVKLMIAKTIRNHPGAIPPSVKSANALNNILAKIEADKSGAFDAVLLNPKGEVAETTSANIFIVRKGVLYTPPLSAGILNGIMRQRVIQIAKQLKISVKEKKMYPADLRNADELFITNVLLGVLPARLCF